MGDHTRNNRMDRQRWRLVFNLSLVLTLAFALFTVILILIAPVAKIVHECPTGYREINLYEDKPMFCELINVYVVQRMDGCPPNSKWIEGGLCRSSEPLLIPPVKRREFEKAAEEAARVCFAIMCAGFIVAVVAHNKLNKGKEEREEKKEPLLAETTP